MSGPARYDDLQRRYADDPRRYFAPLANELRKAGDAERAIALCREHLATQPDHLTGHVILGKALYAAGRRDEAARAFAAALAVDPENVDALHQLALLARDEGDGAAAQGYVERALAADPQSPELLMLLDQLGAPPEDSVAPPAMDLHEAFGLGGAGATAEPVAGWSPGIPAAPGGMRSRSLDELMQGSADPTSSAPAAEHARGSEAPESEGEPAGDREGATAAAEELPVGYESPHFDAAQLVGSPDEPVDASRFDAAILDASIGLDAALPFDAEETHADEPAAMEAEVGPGPVAPEPAPGDAPAEAAAGEGAAAALEEPGVEWPDLQWPADESVAPSSATDGWSASADEIADRAAAAAEPSTEAPAAAEPSTEELLDFSMFAPVRPELPAELASRADPLAEAIAAVGGAPAADPVELAGSAGEPPAGMAEAPRDGGDERADPPLARLADEAEVPAEARVAFTTTTMAELLLAQGRRAEALDVYRQLAESHPDDDAIHARLAELAREGSGGEAAEPVADAALDPVAPSGDRATWEEREEPPADAQAAVPDESALDAVEPDAVEPDAVEPDAVEPDAAPPGERAHGAGVPDAQTSDAEAPDALPDASGEPAAAGPSIGELLARVLAWAPGREPARSEGRAPASDETTSSPGEAEPVQAAASGAPAHDAAAPDAAAPDATSGLDPLAALFGAPADAEAERAADQLAELGALLADPAGAAAERAAAALAAAPGGASLEAVLRAPTPAPEPPRAEPAASSSRTTPSFSFDQFFRDALPAEPAPSPRPATQADGTPAAPAPEGAAAERPADDVDDVDDFHAWLESLRQS